jgi:prevent-host-death family protein
LVQDAKNRFVDVVEAARLEPQMITERGKAAVAMIDAGEYERLRQLDRASAPSFVDVLLAMPQDDGAYRS